MKMILAYDLGTGGNKASLYDSDGNLVSSTFHGYETYYPQTGWYDQRPDDWWQAVVASTRELLATSGVNPADILGIGISGHSLGCVPLSSEGTLLRDATPIWSDKRPVAEAASFLEKVSEEQWYERTGNGFPATHYTVFKILWYKNNEPEMYGKVSKIVGTKDYVNYRLTGRMCTDYSYASGCGAYNLLKWDYDEEYLDILGLPRDLFPEILPSSEVIGTLTEEASSELGLPQTVRVVAGGVDNSCMALGAKNTQPGRLYTSLGSSSWIGVSATKPLLDVKTRPYVFTHVIPGMFASHVGVFSTGTTFRWVRDQLCQHGLEQASQEGINIYEWMIREALKSPVGAHGLMMNPSLAGGSSLEPSARMRGGIVGLDLGHTLCDIIRASMEGISLNLRTALDSLRCLSPLGDSMVAVGGGSISDAWCQIYADACRISLEKTNVGQNAAALGAAALAAVGTGLWEDFSRIDKVHVRQAYISPREETALLYDELAEKFRRTARALASLAD